MSEPTLAAGPAASAGTTETSSQPVGTSEANGQAAPTGDSQPKDTSGGRNPAWSSLLDKLPSEFHSLIEPDLKSWDENFQNSLTKKADEVQSRYSPYSFLVDDEVPPENVQASLQLMAMIEADPKAFYDKMGEYYKDQWGQGQEVSQGSSEPEFSLDGSDEKEFDVTQHPKFQELAQNQEALATYLAQQIEKENEAKAEKELEAEEARLKDQYGEYDQEFVYSYAVQNEVPLEDAVKKFVALRDQFRSAPRASDSAPGVFSPSGGVPSSQPQPGKLSDRETRALVAEFAARANSQG
jgi:hypothetical protein